MELLKVLSSERVTERQHAFTPLFCRQVIWAIVEDGRAYFATQLTLDDFIGQHPDDIDYPESTILEIKQNIRTQSPIFRSSFPAQWLLPQHERDAHRGGVNSLGGGGHSIYHPPITSIQTYSPSVVSAVSALTAVQHAPTPSSAPVLIRATNIHPKIKAALASYVQRFKSVRLTQLLTSLNLTLADLPTLPAFAASDTSLCYNFILGRCVHSGCVHKHVPAADVTDEFADKIVTILAPAVQQFMTSGAPPQPRLKRRCRE